MSELAVMALIEQAIAEDRALYEAAGLAPFVCYQCRDQFESDDPRLRMNRSRMVFCSEGCRLQHRRAQKRSLDAA